MHIPPTTLNDINADILHRLTIAAGAHVQTGRRATVTLKLTITREKDTGKRLVKGRVCAVIPEGADDSRTLKGEPVVLISVTDDHPGQQRI